MPLVIPGHEYRVAIGPQTVEGTPVTTMAAEIPVYAGPVKPMEDRQNIEVADGNAFEPGEYKARAWAEGTVEWMAFTSTVGRLFAAHLGSGCDSKAFSTPNATHTMTRKDTPLYQTLYVYKPNGDGTYSKEQYSDCVAKTLEVQYSSGSLVKIATDILGKTAKVVTANPSTTTTNTATSTAYGLTWVGSTLKLDLGATPASTVVHNFSDFVVHMGYDNMALGWTDDIAARYFDIGRWTLSFSGTYTLEDWNAYNATFYGATAPSAGTAISPTILSGSLDFLLAIGSTADANNTVEIAIPNMDFAVDPPAIDPGGKGITVNMTGTLIAPTSGAPLTVTVKNQDNTAYG